MVNVVIKKDSCLQNTSLHRKIYLRHCIREVYIQKLNQSSSPISLQNHFSKNCIILIWCYCSALDIQLICLSLCFLTNRTDGWQNILYTNSSMCERHKGNEEDKASVFINYGAIQRMLSRQLHKYGDGVCIENIQLLVLSQGSSTVFN